MLAALEAEFDQGGRPSASGQSKRAPIMTARRGSVEYYLRERDWKRPVWRMWLVRCTSPAHQTTSTTWRMGLMFRGAIGSVWGAGCAANCWMSLADLARGHRATVPMLARTQVDKLPTPTSLGKEIAVFAHAAAAAAAAKIEAQEYLGKFNGAVGAYNAHIAAYPEIDWLSVSRDFRGGARLDAQSANHADRSARLAGGIGACPDALQYRAARFMPRYVELYLPCHTSASRLWRARRGSSTMPHKVNPIDFENAEANLGVSNALFRAPGGQAAHISFAARPQRPRRRCAILAWRSVIATWR